MPAVLSEQAFESKQQVLDLALEIPCRYGPKEDYQIWLLGASRVVNLKIHKVDRAKPGRFAQDFHF